MEKIRRAERWVWMERVPLSNKAPVWTKAAEEILDSIARYCTRINKPQH